MTKQVDQIRKALQARKENQGLQQSLIRFLMAKGVCPSVAGEIAEEFFHSGKDVPLLQTSVMSRLHTKAPTPPPFSLTLVGPTGVGKTTTLLKLAALYTQSQLKVQIVDLEMTPKLEMIAKGWNIPYTTDIQKIKDYDICLIDTPGCNFYQDDRIEQLAELLTQLPPTDILLTLSAATKDLDLYGAIHQFSCLDIAGLIFTKLDETLAGGVLLNVCQKTHYPLRYIAYGYPLPGKIEVADPKLIANKILTDMNCSEFSALRQLIFE